MMLAKMLQDDMVKKKLDALNEDTRSPWSLVEEKLYKKFQFLNFNEAFAFMSHVAKHANELNHHPEWSNNYRLVEVYLITHIPSDHEGSALTDLDFKLAARMDKTATAIHELKGPDQD